MNRTDSLYCRDPTLKRTLCKQCDTVLLPGSTATVRIKSTTLSAHLTSNDSYISVASGSHRHAVTYTCLACNTSRRIPAPPIVDVNSATPQSADSEAQAAQPSASMTTPGILAGALADIMDVDPPAGASEPLQQRGKGRNRWRRAVPRVPPLFERPGHVVFRGSEQLSEYSTY